MRLRRPYNNASQLLMASDRICALLFRHVHHYLTINPFYCTPELHLVKQDLNEAADGE
jgi:hypothetical protein